MRTLGAGEKGGVETLVAESIAAAVEEAEVVAVAAEGGGCGGQSSSEGDNVGIHCDCSFRSPIYSKVLVL